MERNPRITSTVHGHMKGPFIFLLCLLCFGQISCQPGFADENGTTEFVENLMTRHGEREKTLKKLAESPLTEEGQKLLIQLLDIEGSIDVVLSSEPYLAYLKTQTGKAYKDFPMYLAAMPTSKRKATTLFVLKDTLPPKATTEEIQLCLDFYFQIRRLFANEPDIVFNQKKLMEFQKKHLNDPLMELYPKEELFSQLPKIIQIGTIPSLIAAMETQVFHDAWQKRLEKFGSREGLLRCAIASPEEFALVRSFVENIDSLEKWILEPLKPQKTKKSDGKKIGEKSQ